MPKSALPPHLQDIEANFEDDKQFGYGWFGRLYTRINQVSKTWFAFSYRCTERWARWRKYPKVLFLVWGKGYVRLEGPAEVIPVEPPYNRRIVVNTGFEDLYLSRIQYWCRWHFAIQWPLMFSFHFYPKAEDVPKPWDTLSDLDGKVWFAYWGHFDADLVYWMVTSMYLGRNWK